jgi:hypothetical protein
MHRWIRWLILALVVAVFFGSVYFANLRRRVAELRRAQLSSGQARRAIEQPKIATPSDVMVKAKFFWASPHSSAALSPVGIELGLSADPVLRSKQILDTLVAGPVNSELRTLPPEASLLEFYLLKDGTAIADFSEALATAIPSGIDSEQMAVDSIARTLEANVPQVRRLKILIHGQETETLAGHLDLTGFFLVRTTASPAEPVRQLGAPPAKSPNAPVTTPNITPPTTPPAKNPAAPPVKNPDAPAKLTPHPAAGKLEPPARKP